MKSDLQIRQDVAAELQWESSLDATHIGVTVTNGVGTLTGHVPSFGDMVTTRPKISSVDLKSGIQAALKRRAVNDAELINIKTNGAEVILSGQVHTWSERDLVIHAAWSAPGVHNVHDHLSVVSD
jgi:osmotically-inducible protein OsmY